MFQGIGISRSLKYKLIMMNRSTFISLAFIGLVSVMCNHPPHKDLHVVDNQWRKLKTLSAGGLLGERLDLWRDVRLWFVADSGFLLSGFETRPGIHPWQGEHVGKWLHAAVLDYQVTHDKSLKKEMDRTVKRLISTQLPNGYLGTYSEKDRFYVVPEDTRGWDVWTHRYNLYGLLVYEKYFPDENVLKACRGMGDLLIETFGGDRNDITRYGTRKGISSTTLLESMVMLYEATGDKAYLEFAEQIVARSEDNLELHLMGAMLNHESVVDPGEGKAYQLMSNLLGYYRLYLCTGNMDYLLTMLNGWEEIRLNHLLVTGGPWTRKMEYNANKECFARSSDFDPGLVTVENCCTVTWIQLNLHLFELTGEAIYAAEAEKAVFNHLLSAQDTNGLDWCYYTPPNEPERAFEPAITCCASSGPRALEMFSGRMAGEIGDHLCISSFAPCRVALPDRFGLGELEISGDYPDKHTTTIRFHPEEVSEYTLEFRIPRGTALVSVELNGEATQAVENNRGFMEVSHRWEDGDSLTVKLAYQLAVHIQSGAEGEKWLAFTYGPLALAQVIRPGMKTGEPFLHQKIDTGSPDKVLSRLEAAEKDKTGNSFRISGTGIILVPYNSIGTRESGPRTYFKCSL